MSTRWIHEGQEYFQMLTCILVSGDSETVLISGLSLIYKQVCTCVSVSLVIVYLVKIHTFAACNSETSEIRASIDFGKWSICVCSVFYCRLKTTEHV